jgi:porin
MALDGAQGRGKEGTLMRRGRTLAAMILVLGLSFGTRLAAEDTGAGSYSGGLLERSTLSGDWLGARNDLAAKGVTFNATLTQIEQGVAGGGKDGTWEYGGRVDLTGNLDTQKLGLWPGGFLTVELESNWADSVNGNTGALLPANTNQLFPLPLGDNVALPELAFTQFVSKYAGVIAGKVQTISQGDLNAFAHGKGDTQFFNTAFNVNPTLLVVPYSTLAAGVIALPTADPHQAVVKFVVTSATGNASTAGFDNLNGAIFLGEGRVRTGFFERTGHQLVGALYSTKRYTSLDQRLGFVIGNRALAKKNDTWAVYYNFDQFLYEIDESAGRGVGVFGRFGASEGNPNPVQYFFSIGLGGKGLLPDRPLDECGLGYYYSSIRNPTFQQPIPGISSFLRDEWGFEAYYKVALTPWFLLTPDIQVVGPAQIREAATGKVVGLATVLGIRLRLVL